MVLLDLSAAFDTLNHDTLLLRLQKDFGLSDTVLEWFRTYIFGRKQQVTTGGLCSETFPMTSGVPQGSVLGPVLFLLYTAPLGRVFEEHHLSYHLYADDTQLSAASSPEPSSIEKTKQEIEICTMKIKAWMDKNSLKMNEEKTEVIVLGRKIHLRNLRIETVNIAGAPIKVSNSIKYLGFRIDQYLSMEDQINHVVKISHWHIRKIRSIRRFIPEKTAATLVISLVFSQLDYCNSLLYGITGQQVHKLQSIQNVCARIVKLSAVRTHITPLLRDLHWLPVHFRINFKLLCMVYRCFHESAPSYLCDLLTPYVPPRSLRSSTKGLLKTPNMNLKTYGHHSFSHAGPNLWRDIPEELRKCESLKTFKKQLKTLLFTRL